MPLAGRPCQASECWWVSVYARIGANWPGSCNRSADVLITEQADRIDALEAEVA
jgi:hypothetical protein